MSKKIAYYALHYGKEYISWSIRSILGAVDEVHILYTDKPSFGHPTNEPCPDTEGELRDEAHRFTGTMPMFWHRGNWDGEGAHRNAICQIARDHRAEMILVVDADEIWAPGEAKKVLDNAWDRNEARDGLAHMVHFWRSFSWLCRDQCRPVRTIDLRHHGGIMYLSQEKPVYHMGYAQREAIMRYKWLIHGHQNELRPGWFEKTFLGWTPGVTDVHPTCELDFWTPEATPPETMAELKLVLGDHPYWGMEIIR
jgi:hypothetical protein